MRHALTYAELWDGIRYEQPSLTDAEVSSLARQWQDDLARHRVEQSNERRRFYRSLTVAADVQQAVTLAHLRASARRQPPDDTPDRPEK